MKRILTIAIVICLAITMTCSSFAVDDDSIIDSSAEVAVAPEADSVNGTVLLCPYCNHQSAEIVTYKTLISEDSIAINYKVVVKCCCSFCGPHIIDEYEIIVIKDY